MKSKSVSKLRSFLSLVCATFCVACLVGCVSGTVVDENGEPLNDVQLFVDYHYSPHLFNWEGRTRSESEIINGDFSILRRKSNYITLSFKKEGYYPEQIRFPEMDVDVENRIPQHGMRIILRKKDSTSPSPQKASSQLQEIKPPSGIPVEVRFRDSDKK